MCSSSHFPFARRRPSLLAFCGSGGFPFCPQTIPMGVFAFFSLSRQLGLPRTISRTCSRAFRSTGASYQPPLGTFLFVISPGPSIAPSFRHRLPLRPLGHRLGVSMSIIIIILLSRVPEPRNSSVTALCLIRPPLSCFGGGGIQACCGIPGAPRAPPRSWYMVLRRPGTVIVTHSVPPPIPRSLPGGISRVRRPGPGLCTRLTQVGQGGVAFFLFFFFMHRSSIVADLRSSASRRLSLRLHSGPFHHAAPD
jgi:hypothetical protein